ncbi:hypothetical protein [Actinomadura madurae]|uniref:hypothetical protein n=1 Tax=Actinomadura madurae TaxID=1993 RepID=UPI0020D20CC5|nr:hypothetical protein [Actinomadura madurae]MCP9947212.1 hypothetical protein [Actinomadura madurae]MCP9963977.1 hypothetical protein [Actinomadura madurae]MCP9976452.1 hypothetical protein [Actinomadura madurae]MCQ0012055.1 hypothetical protein [Actinomadura madurae]MCQ0012645.1 hypothetical protein [Actinomadura madurae]
MAEFPHAAPPASAARTPGHPIRITWFPPGWDHMGGPWIAVPLAELTIAGKVIACLECGAVVVPQLREAHEKRCGVGSHV